MILNEIREPLAVYVSLFNTTFDLIWPKASFSGFSLEKWNFQFKLTGTLCPQTNAIG